VTVTISAAVTNVATVTCTACVPSGDVISGQSQVTAGDQAIVRVLPLCGLGDFVWFDANANGIQDAGEAGISNVTVRLLDGSGNALGPTVTTDANGKYLFANLVAGAYAVQFVTPTGYVLTPADQGADDAKDSDADTTTGKTPPVTLAAGTTNLTLDAGMCSRNPRCVW